MRFEGSGLMDAAGDKKNRFIVTGAAGHLGGTIMRLLAERGADASGLLLAGESEKVRDPRFTYFRGDVRDADSMRPLFESARGEDITVIHTAAIISIAEKLSPRLYDVNVNGTKNVLRLCREYGVKRLVHVSSVHAIPELPRGRTMSEVGAFSADSVHGGYAKTKAEAAQAVLDAAEAGLDAVIVFPSGIIGPYDKGNNHLTQMVVEYAGGKLPACVKGGYDFVDVRDVAGGCLLAAERGRRGEGYILSGHYVPIGELLSKVGSRCGRGSIPALPIWLARAAVPPIELYAKARRIRPLYTAYSLHTLSGNGSFSNEKARRELGYDSRPVDDTVRDMVAWLGENMK
jgi:dihydroflavonol-4-reductase